MWIESVLQQISGEGVSAPKACVAMLLHDYSLTTVQAQQLLQLFESWERRKVNASRSKAHVVYFSCYFSCYSATFEPSGSNLQKVMLAIFGHIADTRAQHSMVMSMFGAADIDFFRLHLGRLWYAACHSGTQYLFHL